MNLNDTHQRLIVYHSLVHWLSAELLELKENKIANKAHELEALLLAALGKAWAK